MPQNDTLNIFQQSMNHSGNLKYFSTQNIDQRMEKLVETNPKIIIHLTEGPVDTKG